MNLSISRTVSPTATSSKRKYLCYVYKGNYPLQIENALMRRGVWKIYDKDSQVKTVGPQAALQRFSGVS